MTPNPSQPGTALGTAAGADPAKEQAKRAWLSDGALVRYRYGLVLCGIATALELFVVGSVLLLPAPQPVLLILLHALACFVAAPGLHSLMPPSQQSPRRPGLLFLFTLTFFMPLFGTLGLLGGLLAERHYPSPPPPPCIWQSLGLSELPHQAGAFTARLEYGDGALSAMLRYCPDPERRLSAVMAVRHLRDANDTEVVRLALTDTADDVRLLAYSILDHKEQAFNARQKDLLHQLDSPTLTADSRTQLEKRMAQTQFEMIELGLCAGEVLDYLLLEARRHIDRALQSDSSDRESLFLLGCIALRQSDLPIAEQAFLHAQVRGMSLEAVLPRLAEIAFRQRRFALVTQYLQAIDPICLRAHPRLSGIAAHWLLEPPK
jgi:hypothetical protein